MDSESRTTASRHCNVSTMGIPEGPSFSRNNLRHKEMVRETTQFDNPGLLILSTSSSQSIPIIKGTCRGMTCSRT